MNRTKISLLIAVIFLPFILMAQDNPEKEKEKKVRDHGLIFLIGPAINYYYGTKEGDKTYSDTKFSWQMDGQLGILSRRNNRALGNFLGVFGSFGSMSSDVLQEVANQSGRSIVLKNRQFNQFYSAEAGMIIFNFIRLSGGIGRQYYEDITELSSSINYFSLTGGLNFNFGAVNLGVNANLLTGDDLIQNQLRLSAGLLVKF
jgi:hypothetical protein